MIYRPNTEEMYFADSQTTVNVQKGIALIEEFRDKFPGLRSLPKMGVCFATSNRQQALDELIGVGIGKLVVIGDPESSNTSELVKIGRSHGLPVEFHGRAHLLKEEMFDQFPKVGVHGGASVLPEEGDIAMDMLKGWGYNARDVVVGKPEPRTFPNAQVPRYDYRSGNISSDVLALTATY